MQVDPALRWPSLKRSTDILFWVASVLLVADVLVPEIWGNGKTKDYALWYWAGQQVLHGQPLYERMTGGTLDYIYPPLAAVLLAIPSYLGKIPLYLFLSLINVVAWWMTAQFSHAMAGSGRKPAPWLEALPGIVTVAFVFDMFDLGQPNLLLLALVLYGFWLLRDQRGWMAGSMFALATAIKVFPVAVLPYLVWRRQWAAAASMLLFIGVFLVVLPAPFRGFQHNVAELKTWYQGMVGSSSEQGFGQRGEQNWSWINQSIIAVTHRLTRPVNYNQEDPAKPVRTINIANVDFGTANGIVLAISLAIGLGYLAVMPPASRRTERSDAEEIAILFCLITVATPLARQYYFLWLFFPITVLLHRAAYDPRPAVKTGTWTLLAIAGGLLCLSLPLFPVDLQAYGNNLAATMVLVVGLAWHLRHPPSAQVALPHAAGGLQVDANNASSKVPSQG